METVALYSCFSKACEALQIWHQKTFALCKCYICLLVSILVIKEPLLVVSSLAIVRQNIAQKTKIYKQQHTNLRNTNTPAISHKSFTRLRPMPYYVKTIQPIYGANKLTGFYLMGIFTCKVVCNNNIC